MTIIPAIDMLGGRCVRLVQGNYEEVQVYGNDPVAVARRFEQQGARRIHLVDLDAARGDPHTNRRTIRKIRKAVSCTLELGGGIRREDDIEELLDMGIDRLVVGTAFAKRPSMVEGWSAHYGKVFLAGIDARDGFVYVSGWNHETSHKDSELAQTASKVGAGGIIYTNIAKDGTLSGPDIAGTNRIAEVSGLPVILSGGISSAEDVSRVVSERHEKVVGIIVGKALYDEAVELASLIEQYQDTEDGDTEW
jgi:phosphoribosylformimino-5-aminoimidazole carboxamide ribotide isomerase